MYIGTPQHAAIYSFKNKTSRGGWELHKSAGVGKKGALHINAVILRNICGTN